MTNMCSAFFGLRINLCGLGLVPHLSSFLAHGPAWVPEKYPCPAVFVPDLATLAAAAVGHAVTDRVAEGALNVGYPVG